MNERAPTLADVLTELRDMRRDMAALRDALKAGRLRTVKRGANVAADVTRRQVDEHQPSEIEIAAATRSLAKRKGRR